MKLISACKSPLLCSVAFVFIVASIWMSIAIDKKALSSGFFETIGGHNTPLGKKYLARIQQRRLLYFQGVALGFLFAIVYLWRLPQKQSLTPFSIACIVSGITLLTAYFYYMLMPKKPLMVLELTNERQRTEWAKIYKTMQWNYHLGLFLGVVGVGIAGFSVAKNC